MVTKYLWRSKNKRGKSSANPHISSVDNKHFPPLYIQVNVGKYHSKHHNPSEMKISILKCWWRYRSMKLQQNLIPLQGQRLLKTTVLWDPWIPKSQSPLRDSQGISSSSCSFSRAQSWKMTKELSTDMLGHNYFLCYSEGRGRESQELSSHPACPGFQKFQGSYANGPGRETSEQNTKPSKAGGFFLQELRLRVQEIYLNVYLSTVMDVDRSLQS